MVNWNEDLDVEEMHKIFFLLGRGKYSAMVFSMFQCMAVFEK